MQKAVRASMSGVMPVRLFSRPRVVDTSSTETDAAAVHAAAVSVMGEASLSSRAASAQGAGVSAHRGASAGAFVRRRGYVLLFPLSPPRPMRFFFWWRMSALAEGVSYLLLLFVAMPLKYLYGQPEAVRWAGSLHGGLFVVFVGLLALAWRAGPMTLRQSALGFAASLVPFGAFGFDRYIVRRVEAEAAG